MRHVSDEARERCRFVEELAQRLAEEALTAMRPHFATGDDVSETTMAFAQKSLERGISADPVPRVAQSLLFLIHDDVDPTWRTRIEEGVSAGPVAHGRRCDGCGAQVWPQYKFCPQCGRAVAS